MGGLPMSKAYGSAEWKAKENVQWFTKHIGGHSFCWHCYHPEETAAVLIRNECVNLKSRTKIDSPALSVLRRWGRTGKLAPEGILDDVPRNGSVSQLADTSSTSI